jgi:hypothetical protein
MRSLFAERASRGIALRSSSALTRPIARSATTALTGTAASRPASSAAVGGLLAALCGWLALFGLLVVAPIVMLANGAAPEAVLGWWALIGVSWVIAGWSERRERRRWLRLHGKPPPQPTSPVAEAFQRRWGLAEESCAKAEKTEPETAWMRLSKWAARWRGGKAEAEPVSTAEPIPAFVVNELPGTDGVYNARVYTVVDAFADTMAEADRLGLTGEDRIEALASVLRGAQLYCNSKSAGSGAGREPAKQRVGGAGGSPRGGCGRLEQGTQGLVIEGKAKRGRLPRWGGSS